MRSLADIDWTTWTPHDVATLLFVIRGGEVLLIRKKRGLGAGKINAPGGRLEPGELPLDAAIRETTEEVGVVPVAPRFRGQLRFQFEDGYALHCHVFSADACTGELIETDEATPMWRPLDELPYEEMWADDRLWLPKLLSGRTPFDGRFFFDGEAMGEHVLTAHDPAEPLFATLASLGIRTETVEHAPVFTVRQAKRLRVAHEGVHVKNLFLRNKKGAMRLVTVGEDRAVDLKSLAEKLDAGHFSFASNDRLRRHLGVEPGSVTPFAVIADREGAVRMVLDRRLVDAPLLQCHPLTNDRTTSIAGQDLVRLLTHLDHAPTLVDLEEASPD